MLFFFQVKKWFQKIFDESELLDLVGKGFYLLSCKTELMRHNYWLSNELVHQTSAVLKCHFWEAQICMCTAAKIEQKNL